MLMAKKMQFLLLFNKKAPSLRCPIYTQGGRPPNILFVSAFFMPIHERIIKYNGFVPP